MTTMTNSERLLSYIESAKAAIKEVTDDSIGHGTDPLGFVIICFVSQAAKIKELLETIENKACRFNCRTKRETFEAGWAARHDYHFNPCGDGGLDERYKEWKKQND